MARKAERESNRKNPRLGQLPPRYKFFLNPYTSARFTTSCPGCSGKTRQRKLPLAIHVHDLGMVILNKTCRFCPCCELLIAHRDEIEAYLARMLPQTAPRLPGDGYLIVGTVQRKDWRRGLTSPLTGPEMLQALHRFKDCLDFKPAPLWARNPRRDGSAKPR